jgi:hypothetical protein
VTSISQQQAQEPPRRRLLALSTIGAGILPDAAAEPDGQQGVNTSWQGFDDFMTNTLAGLCVIL